MFLKLDGNIYKKFGGFTKKYYLCIVCGWINQDLNLSAREWTCKSCGVIHDKDVNAAKNILNEGLKIRSGGTLDNTDGDSNKTSVKKHKSVKSEAQPIASGVGG